MKRGACWVIVHGVAKSQTQLSMHVCTHVDEYTCMKYPALPERRAEQWCPSNGEDSQHSDTVSKHCVSK